MSKPSGSEIHKVHIALNVGDVAQSIEFYRKLFAVGPVKVRPGYAKFDLGSPPLNLALNEAALKEKGGLSHLGIQVGSTGEVLETRDRWRVSGLEVLDEMRTQCCYALQDKAWARDPDGNRWEVFTVLEDNLPATSSCCGDEQDALVTPG